MREQVLAWRGPLVLACRKHHVLPALAAALMDWESGGRQTEPNGSVVTSSAGCLGLMQVSVGVGDAYGLDLAIADENIEAGVRYLSEQLDRFHDVRLALAAYNAGPSAVAKFGDVPPFDETQRYVPGVLGLLSLYLELDGDLIWGADPAQAPATGSYQEALANVLGVANARRAVIEHLHEEADRALSLA